jgi:hypothetical protein
MTDASGGPAHAEGAGVAFQRGLSSWNARFLDTAISDRAYRQRADGVRSFQGLPSHSWPTFVDTDRIQEWAQMSISLRRVILTAGVSLVPKQARAIADLFGYSVPRASLVARLLANRGGRDWFASRADFLVSGAGLQCCELDFGDIGLWHIVTFDTMFRQSPVVEQFVARSGVPVRERNPFGTMVQELVKLVGRRGSVRECNFIVVVPDDTPAEALAAGRREAAYACSLYQAALRTLGLDGELVVERAGRLTFHGDHASIDGKRIQVLMTQTPTLAAEDQAWAEFPFLDLVERGGVIAVNGPDSSAVSNKIVLALVSEAADAGRLDADAAALVRSTLPWTRRIIASKVSYRAQEHWLPELLVSRKDHFVLKPGDGVASDGVRIGRNTSPSEWERAAATALEQGTWVVQEAVGGTPLWFVGEDDELIPHGVNIGIVLCGNEYVGAFLRLMPLASPDEMPTIGYSLGALTGGVIEVDG